MMIKQWKIPLVVLLAIGLGIVVLIAISRDKTSQENTRELSPHYGTMQTFISTTGTVQPQNRLEIKPPISGRIEKIFVTEGERVKVGQTVAWMSSTERAALLDAARAQGDATVAYWQNVYKPTPLIAPIDGEVIVKAVEPGQTVTSSDPVIVLSDRLIVKAQVDETDIGKVKLGQTAMISLDAYPQTNVKAIVDHIAYESKIVNNVTIYEVDILPDTAPEVFRSGMSANVDIIEHSKDNILIIPLDAITYDDEGSFVLIRQADDNEPVKRRVKLGISNDKYVEVVSGLKEQEKIVVTTLLYAPSKNSGSGSSPLMPFGRRR